MKPNLRRNAYTLLEIAVVLGILAILAAVLFPIWARNQENRRNAECLSHLKQISLAMLQYSQDHAERFPLVASNEVPSSLPPFAKPFGWADTIAPYLRSTMLLQCPSDNHSISADATRDGFTDYWYNSNLNAVRLDSFVDASDLPSLFDTHIITVIER